MAQFMAQKTRVGPALVLLSVCLRFGRSVLEALSLISNRTVTIPFLAK